MLSSHEAIHEALRIAQPTGALFYSLTRTDVDPWARYPATGVYTLVSPYQPPTGVPNGKYLIHYYNDRIGSTPLPASVQHPTPTIRIVWPEKQLTDSAAQKPEDPSPELLTKIKSLKAALMLNSDPDLKEAGVEYLKRQMAARLAQKTQRAIREGRYTQEIGEILTALAAQRQDSNETWETSMAMARRTTEQAQQMISVISGANQLAMRTIEESKEVLSKIAQPPPPPDYTGPLSELVKMARDLGVAYFQGKGGRRKRKLLPASEVKEAGLLPSKSEAGDPPAKETSSFSPTAPRSAAADPSSPASNPASDSQPVLPAPDSAPKPESPTAQPASVTSPLRLPLPEHSLGADAQPSKVDSTAPKDAVPDVSGSPPITDALVNEFVPDDDALASNLMTVFRTLQNAEPQDPTVAPVPPVTLEPPRASDLMSARIESPQVETVVDPQDPEKVRKAQEILSQFASLDDALLVLTILKASLQPKG